MIDGWKVGVAITTVSNKKEVTDVFTSCYNTIIPNLEGVDHVFIHDDCSTYQPHIDYLRSLESPLIHVHISGGNVGVPVAKNRCIDYLINQKKCDIIFLLDDDVVIKDPSWTARYVDCMKKTPYRFLSGCSKPEIGHLKNRNVINGITMVDYILLQGVFLVLHREAVEKIGGFVYRGNKYGHEHTEYTHRAHRVVHPNLFQHPDIEGSNKLWDYLHGDNTNRVFTSAEKIDRISTTDKIGIWTNPDYVNIICEP
jgi:glycosyltransferase involved in cell wall biosynthesis